jgi:DNA polymerase I
MQWLLIDGNSWFAGDYYAMQEKAVGNFMYRLRTMREQFGFNRVAVAWDSRQSFRKELSPAYKTHRGGKPEGFETALLRTKQTVAHECECFEAEGFEGDDVLATLVQDALDEGVKAVICSADKDLHQCLVDGRVSQITSQKRINAQTLAVKTMTSVLLRKTYGVAPHQWVDYRVIVGDPSDGIAGCKHLGESAAREVLQRCGDLDGFYASPFSGGLNNRQRTLLLNHRREVPLLRQLLTLRRDCPLPRPTTAEA